MMPGKKNFDKKFKNIRIDKSEVRRMQRRPLTEKHYEKLKEFALSDLPLEACVCLSYDPGEILIQEDMPIKYLYLVLSGRAKVCSTTPNGKHLVLCYYVSKGILGDVELMADANTATATVIAITEFECIAVPYQRNAAALRNHVEFLNIIGKELAFKLITSSHSLISASLCTGEERLCSYILHASHNGIFRDTLTDTAYSLGMSYRHMLRLLNQLCCEKVLEKSACGYHILNRDVLIRRAGNEGGL